MMRAIILCVVIILFAAVVSLSSFLGPDDLAECGGKPDETRSRCQSADAIVAISGGDTAARTAEAVSLYQLGWAPKLIFSGAAFDDSSPSNASTMRDLAVKAGVNPDDITVEELARNTEENAQRIREITNDETPERIILVTSAYHQRRANIEFRHYFLNSTAIINHPVANDSDWSGSWWASGRGWWLAGGEVAKILFLYVRGIF